MEARVEARDEDIGLFAHVTSTAPLGGRLKSRIEDFRVEEVGGEPARDEQGPYVCARIRLTNWETNRFVATASDRLRISRKKIHFSGTKDKRGVTAQLFTFEAPPDEVQALGRVPGVEVADVYRCSSEAQLGDHDFNGFEIVVRALGEPLEAIRTRIGATWTEAETAGGFPNFYGPQRFGAVRATTHRVGERILRGDFQGAVHAYLGTAPLGFSADEIQAWTESLAAGRHNDMLRMCRADQGFERTLLHRLIEKPADWLNALLGLPKNLQVLFVYAYQSFLFNKIVSQRIKDGLPLGQAVEGDLIAPIELGRFSEEWIPAQSRNLARINEEIQRGRAVVTALLPGTEAPMAEGGPGDIERRVLSDHDVTRSTFVVPEHLDWSSKGSRRAIAVRPSTFAFDVEEDALHPGRRLARFRFRLPRGAYATSVLREFVKSPRLADYA
ncbi:MAG TPA: tRNA pseudouridine(13) synthase TruD [Candidatus Thermoplasmatota archaeon]|nr:tRNA pseudouridine(13) synthase TruD [Candidatus Thermoplasmatota archaeon]